MSPRPTRRAMIATCLQTTSAVAGVSCQCRSSIKNMWTRDPFLCRAQYRRSLAVCR